MADHREDRTTFPKLPASQGDVPPSAVSYPTPLEGEETSHKLPGLSQAFPGKEDKEGGGEEDKDNSEEGGEPELEAGEDKINCDFKCKVLDENELSSISSVLKSWGLPCKNMVYIFAQNIDYCWELVELAWGQISKMADALQKCNEPVTIFIVYPDFGQSADNVPKLPNCVHWINDIDYDLISLYKDDDRELKLVLSQSLNTSFAFNNFSHCIVTAVGYSSLLRGQIVRGMS